VVGATAEALQAVIAIMGPRRGGQTFVAFTDWEIIWDYSIASVPGGLRISGANIAVRASVVVPRWRPSRSVSPDLIAAWKHYTVAIEVHEQGHVNLAVEAGRSLLGRLDGLSTFSNLGALEAAVVDAANAAIGAAREAERCYDEASEHGAVNGVVLR
jgi:predicted secreted Zn-dependent protease